MAKASFTKKELAMALKRLTTEKLFEQITVGEIVEECGVNRQTFYYHFADKFELLDWIYNNEAFLPLTVDISFENWDEKLCEFLRIMQDNKAFYMNTIKCSNNYFEEYLRKMLRTLIDSAITELDVEEKLEKPQKRIYVRILAYGITGVIIDWAMAGMKEDAVFYAKYVRSLVLSIERFGFEIYSLRKELKMVPADEEPLKIPDLKTLMLMED